MEQDFRKKPMLSDRKKGMTYQEIADKHHMTRQRVFQIIGSVPIKDKVFKLPPAHVIEYIDGGLRTRERLLKLRPLLGLIKVNKFKEYLQLWVLWNNKQLPVGKFEATVGVQGYDFYVQNKKDCIFMWRQWLVKKELALI